MKYFFVISRYPENDYRTKIFREVFSPRNKEFAEKHGLKYVEITNEQHINLVRGNPTWWKFSIPLSLINAGTLEDGDTLIHYDSDILNCKPEVSLELPEGKSFGYSIDSGNTCCMGFYSVRINEWSKQLFRNVMDEERWERLKDQITIHERFGTYSSYAQEFREQSMIHRMFGVPRHSDKSYWDFNNHGWHLCPDQECIYSLGELDSNVHVFPTAYNVTEWEGESSLQFNINGDVKKEDVVLRHFTGCTWENYKNWI